MARTHSKALTLDQLCSEAFGVLGLHPWEFDEYSFNEYLQKRDGYYAHRHDNLQAEYQHFRVVAYWAVYPHLKQSAQRKSVSDIIPDIYEPPPKPKDAAWVKEMQKIAKERAKRISSKLKPVKKNGRPV